PKRPGRALRRTVGYGRMSGSGPAPKPVIFARGLVRSIRIGSRVTCSVVLPAESLAVTFRYTLGGRPVGTCQEYLPVFGIRFGVTRRPLVASVVTVVATGFQVPVRLSHHSSVIGSSVKFLSVASHWSTRASGALASATAGKIFTVGAVTSTMSRMS